MLKSPLPLVALLAVLPAAAQAESPPAVEIVTVQAAPATREHRLIGTVEAANSAPASFRFGGRIAEINLEVGDHVAAGDVIARVDPTVAEANFRAAEASLQAAEAALLQAEQARTRAEGLLERGVGTQSQLDEATEAYLSAYSSRRQAEAQLESTRQALDDTVLRAIRDAIVTERHADPDEIVGAGQAIVVLASETERDAVFYAPDIAALDEARAHSISLSSEYMPASIEANISEISPLLGQNGTVEIHASIPPGAGAALSIGDQISALASLPAEPGFVVPWTALTATPEGPAVWRVDPGTMQVQLAPVEVTAYSDDMVEISAGVAAGDLVVGSGSQFLYPGRVVSDAGDLK